MLSAAVPAVARRSGETHDVTRSFERDSDRLDPVASDISMAAALRSFLWRAVVSQFRIVDGMVAGAYRLGSEGLDEAAEDQELGKK